MKTEELLKTDEPDQIFQMTVGPKITHTYANSSFNAFLLTMTPAKAYSESVHVVIVTLQIPSTLTLNLQPNKTLIQHF